MSNNVETRKQKIAYWWFCNQARICMIITTPLLVYDMSQVLVSIFTMDFIFHPNHVVHMIWRWYITIPLGIAWIWSFIRWIGPPPF